MTDFAFSSDGSVCTLHPNTEEARDWVEEHIGQDNGFQPWWPIVVIEPRYAGAVLEGLTTNGLTVQEI